MKGQVVKDHLPWREWGSQLSNKFWIKKIIKSIFNFRIEFLPASNRNCTVSILVDPFGDNYFHWFTEVLPKLFFLKDAYPKITVLLPQECNKEFQMETLRRVGVKVIHMKKDGIFLRRSIISSPFSEYSGYFQAIFAQPILSLFKDVKPKDSLVPRRLYISRKLAPRRKIINEHSILPILTQQGFEVVYPERLSFLESISLYKSASVIVSLHGAALTNMIFLCRQASILELRLEKIVVDKCYFIMANALGIKYYYQNCKSIEDNKAHIEANIIVDINELKSNLESIIKKNL